MNKKISFPIAIIIIVVLAVIVGGGTLAYQYWWSQKPVACTMEAKVCPDGSAVGRTGPNCEFAPCPKENINKTAVKEQSCIDSGGTVSTSSCCKSSSDFPNTCLIGICGCSPDNSQSTKVCDCGEGKCFNGEKCISIAAEKFSQRWYYTPSEAPEGYLVFQENGILEIPAWITGKVEKTKLNWSYNKEKEILTINFQLMPDLFPENEELAKDFFSVDGYSLTGSFVGYNKENLNVEIYVSPKTEALNFFGWIFYKVEDDETADWKTYRNEEYGFTLKYPNKYKIEVSSVTPNDYYPGGGTYHLLEISLPDPSTKAELWEFYPRLLVWVQSQSRLGDKKIYNNINDFLENELKNGENLQVESKEQVVLGPRSGIKISGTKYDEIARKTVHFNRILTMLSDGIVIVVSYDEGFSDIASTFKFTQ